MSGRGSPSPGLATALSLGLVMASPALATIEARSPASSITVPAADIPSALTAGDFSCAVWLKASGLAAGPMSILEVPGTLSLRLDPMTRSVDAQLVGATGTLDLSIPLDDGGTLPVNQWMLLTLSWDAAGGVFEGRARAEGTGEGSDQAIDATLAPAAPTGDLVVGAHAGAGTAAMPGWYGLTVVRDHALVARDFADLWSSGDYLAPSRLDNTGAGGSFAGTGGVAWMINHAIVTKPHATINPNAVAALPGVAANLNNVAIFNADLPGSTNLTVGNLASVTNGADKFAFASPYDLLGPGAPFTRQIPGATLPEPPWVGNVSPKLNELANGTPTTLIRCIVSANSRGVSTADADEMTWAENYAHGFISAQLPLVAGVLNRPAATWPDVRWFGFDTGSPPRTTGTVLNVTDSARDFKRLWTGSGPATYGPGLGVWIGDGATYSMKCRPEDGSLLVVEAPLVIRAYVLRMPGGGELTWRPEQALAQSFAGTLGAPTTVDLGAPDAVAYTMVSGDVADERNRRLVLGGDLTADITPGDAVYVGGGAGERGFAVVESVQLDDADTEVVLEHFFNDTPQPGSVMHFGAWEFVTVEYEWPALSGVDPERWRGIELSSAGGPIVVLAYDAWRPDVAGIAYGVAGWGGNGYTPQMDETIDVALTQWMTRLEPDVWLQGFAQQDSGPGSMHVFLDRIREATPGVEVAWLGDGEHGNDAFHRWHESILQEAAANDVVAVSLLQDEQIGTWADQVVDGQRQDAAHWSLRGNRRLAERWLARLATAAGPAPDGDANGDGVVDVNDMVLVISNWGPCPAPPVPCTGDTDGDGLVDVNDLVAVITNWS